MPERIALVAGATGLVGGLCLRRLLEEPSYARVTALVRRPTGLSHPKLAEALVDFEHLEVSIPNLQAQDVFCCLGTTLAQAGSVAALRRVDFDYALAVSRLARANGARRLFLVSSTGASPSSWSPYMRIKGELEREAQALGYETFVVLRPSLLLGERERPRLKEEAGAALMRLAAPMLIGPFRRLRAIPAEQVAAALVSLARRAPPGRLVLESDAVAAEAAGGQI